MHGWIHVDDAYAGQIARRMALVAENKNAVIAQVAGSEAATEEALWMILESLALKDGFQVLDGAVHCPDGRVVTLDDAPPLELMARIIQEDICILEKPEGSDEHILSAALLCFPASWTLAEKIGKPMRLIHEPVGEYDEALAKRVQRLFDGVQVGGPLWRFNRLWYDEAELYQPKSETETRPLPGVEKGRYLRSERQTLVRLPKTRAVIFSIHTYVVAREAVPQECFTET